MIYKTLQRNGDRGREELEDTKEVIRIRISKKNIQHNGQKKKKCKTIYKTNKNNVCLNGPPTNKHK
jgi:hypothetical protein